MSEQPNRKRRTNRVFKSLHQPLTYLGVERTLFALVKLDVVSGRGAVDQTNGFADHKGHGFGLQLTDGPLRI